MKFDIKKLQGILDQAVEAGEECGLQLAIYDHGELAVDICSGFADRARSVEVTPQTLFPIFSCGKGVITAAFHMLAEKGLIRYDGRIADYWPEYGCCGKEDTLVWHALTHRAAVSFLPALDKQSDMADWELMCSKLARTVPTETPGGKCRYHAITFAWLIGETASRAAGMPFKEFIRREIIAPLGLEEEFFFGLDPDAESRYCQIDGPENDWCRQFMENPDIRRGFIPSANGVSSARALAKIYGAVTAGVDGKKLLSDAAVRNAAILRRAPDDPCGGTWAKFGLGWALPCAPENSSLFGHGGALGGEGFADLEKGISLAFLKNHVTPTHPVHPVRDRISEALGLPIRHW